MSRICGNHTTMPVNALRPADRFRRTLLVRLRRRTWLAVVEQLAFAALILIATVSYLILAHGHPGQRLLTPPLVALMLVSNLVPAIILLMMWGRRVALRRAAHSPLGGTGRLHVRLVGIFSVAAAVATPR